MGFNVMGESILLLFLSQELFHLVLLYFLGLHSDPWHNIMHILSTYPLGQHQGCFRMTDQFLVDPELLFITFLPLFVFCLTY